MPLDEDIAEVAEAREGFALTEGQAAALACVDACIDRCAGEACVVDGVTGSGKTEVYLRAIRHALELGRGAIVLVPEIALTPQTVSRFEGRFGDTVAVMHSRMTAGERFDQWEAVRLGKNAWSWVREVRSFVLWQRLVSSLSTKSTKVPISRKRAALPRARCGRMDGSAHRCRACAGQRDSFDRDAVPLQG